MKYQIWRSLRAVREAGAEDVAGAVAAAPDILEDANLRKRAIACSLDLAVEAFRERHLSCEEETQLLAKELLRTLEHWSDVDTALPLEVSSGWEAAVASLKGVTVSGLTFLRHCWKIAWISVQASVYIRFMFLVFSFALLRSCFVRVSSGIRLVASC